MTTVQRNADRRAAKPHPWHDILDAVWHVQPRTVLIMIGASMGLGLVGYQVETTWVVALFAVFWGLTVLAILVITARLLTERPEHPARGAGVGTGAGRHRRPAH
ncbi:hypothetical protein ACFYNO_14080 [Kitasatospora sp. NPDC006697]|uniref:hypothetical protein n=1 Tax=Kitasatospora sp. NPDC006697 TaxID=3364020 RepID=UPI003697A30E